MVRKQHVAEEKLSSLIGGYLDLSLLYAAIRADLPELLKDGPKTPAELAGHGGLRLASLERLMRGWELVGLCEKDAESRYKLTDMGAALAKDAAGIYRSQIQLVVEQYIPAFREIEATLHRDELPFVLAHGLPPFEFRRANPHASAVFDDWHAHQTRIMGSRIIETYDWTPFGHIADIAGGNGNLLRAIREKNGTARLTLFEQAHVIDPIANDLSKPFPAIETIVGNVFENIPVEADLYILKSVLHDWGDEDVLRILRNIGMRMPAGSRLLIIERTLDETSLYFDSAVQVDLHMLAVTGGLERTFEQFSTLLQHAGFAQPQVTKTKTPFYLIETARLG